MKRRRRRCEECGKPLGSTLGKCHECGGETYRAGGDMTDTWAWNWKIMLGIKPKLIEKHHGRP